MNFELKNFFIPLVDFFSMQFGMKQGFPLNGAETGVLFLFASYLLGHFAFVIISAVYDWVYRPALCVELSQKPATG